MKNKEIFELREALNDVDYIKGKVFAYAVFKNKALLDDEIKVFDSIRKAPHPDFQKYENERTALCQMHSEKDEGGNPVLNYNPNGTQSFKILNQDDFKKDYEKMVENYTEVLDDMTKNQQEFNEFLEKDSEVRLIKIEMKDLPDEITAKFLENIKHMVK